MSLFSLVHEYKYDLLDNPHHQQMIDARGLINVIIVFHFRLFNIPTLV